jgi:hypothetical protein
LKDLVSKDLKKQYGKQKEVLKWFEINNNDDNNTNDNMFFEKNNDNKVFFFF